MISTLLTSTGTLVLMLFFTVDEAITVWQTHTEVTLQSQTVIYQVDFDLLVLRIGFWLGHPEKGLPDLPPPPPPTVCMKTGMNPFVV